MPSYPSSPTTSSASSQSTSLQVFLLRWNIKIHSIIKNSLFEISVLHAQNLSPEHPTKSAICSPAHYNLLLGITTPWPLPGSTKVCNLSGPPHEHCPGPPLNSLYQSLPPIGCDENERQVQLASSGISFLLIFAHYIFCKFSINFSASGPKRHPISTANPWKSYPIARTSRCT